MWWDNLKADKATSIREREEWAKQLHAVVVSNTSTPEQREGAYRAYVSVLASLMNRRAI